MSKNKLKRLIKKNKKASRKAERKIERDRFINDKLFLRKQLATFYTRTQLFQLLEYKKNNPESLLTKPIIDDILNIDESGSPVKEDNNESTNTR